jgi:probable phosphoglycerate mutase
MDLEVEILETLDEIDYGDWTGRSLIELEKLPRWQQYNAYRSGTRIPNGELMLEAQARIVAEMERLRDLHPEDTIALVSHGDLIKAAVACYVGAPLDLFQRIEIHPASISVLALDDHGPQLRCLNNTGELCLA